MVDTCVYHHAAEINMTLRSVFELIEQYSRRKGGGGSGGSKKGEGDGKMKGMMMMFQLKAAILGAIALKFIGIVAFKALLIAKVALTLSSIIALKKLLEGKHHTSTYEVVATHPHHDDYGHVDRSFMQDQLAYKGYQGAARNRFS
ncbi:hypothetical protein GWI33_009519 [Rhynchophorus ferrugineus]|uniref:Uncharacterized protein n=1 Tax=Rhynchophorus ferrugineus TaxID=354439 RepID=A0A834IFM5_RHYFE|nr:hypothetical protein GWI33_009519 [Rhynchophorus ferrugineus]